MLFYFSGTGNSLKSALTIARKLEGAADSETRIVCMGPEIGSEPDVKAETDGSPGEGIKAEAGVTAEVDGASPASMACGIEPCDTIGFIFPCHFGGAPKHVLDFVRALDLTGQDSAYRYAVVTYGAISSFTIEQLNAVITEKGYPLDYGATVKAFSNYVVLYKMNTKLSEKTALLKSGLELVASDILRRHRVAFKRPNAFLGLYNKIVSSDVHNTDRHFAAGDACAACGQCAKVCPVGNITIEGDPPRPRWHHRCTQCLACLQLCPHEAIDYGTKTRGRGRYKHPEVTVPMLIAFNNNRSETLDQRY